MSMNIHHYLNDVGGNFTEMAPRPPVPGEENEQQSSGGTSTKSGASHKSHHSSKSHSSGKSGVSHHSDISPAATPRRSNLERCHISSTPRGKLFDVDAPLGFEPEGSAASSPPFTENSTPAYHKWAENFHNLMDDSDGVKLFKSFLDQESSSHTLDFLFACRGMKMVPSNEKPRIQSLIKLIYKKYIKGDQLSLRTEAKKLIVEKLKAGENFMNQSIFDEAEKDVEECICSETYPQFLKSDLYILYVQNGGDSPKTTGSNNSSGSNSVRPLISGPLPSVPEEKELKHEDIHAAANSSSNTTLVLTPSNLMVTSRIRAKESFTRRQDDGSEMGLKSCGQAKVSANIQSVFPRPGPRIPNPYHVSYAPVSQQDSELQSLSSDAPTDDTMSLTDSSVDGRELPYGPKRWKKQLRQIRSSAAMNKHTGLSQNIIPRTERAPKDRNIAETQPAKFAAILIERLEKVRDDQTSKDRLDQHIRSIEAVDEDIEPCKPAVVLETSVGVPAAKADVSMPMEALLLSMTDDQDENAQSILDDHCSRIWVNSSGQTPSRSPGRQSPDRSLARANAPGPNVSAVSAIGDRSIGDRSYGTVPKSHHKRRGDRSINNDSALSQDNSALLSEQDKTGVYYAGEMHHKHVHHHHYHHHATRDARGRSQSAEHHGSHKSTPHHTGPRTRGKHEGKRSSDSSTVDSGVSLVCDPATPMLNMNDPASKKVLEWMRENDNIQTGTNHYSTDNSDKSSQKKSNKSSSPSQHKSTSSGGKKAPVQYNVSRSGSLDRSGLHQSLLASSSTATGSLGDFPFPSATSSGALVLPQPHQPIMQDPGMPPLDRPNPTTQLEEAKRRLDDAIKLQVTKSSSREKRSTPTLPVHLATPRSLPVGKSSIPHSQTVPLDLSSSEELSSSSSRSEKKKRSSSSAPQTPGPDVTVVGYYYCNEPIPYRTTIPGSNVTLAQFKQLLTKRGNFRYFFKKASDEFDCGVVHEEVIFDEDVLPLWDGKIVGKVQSVE